MSTNQTNRERNRAAIRAKSPVTLSDAECDQVARFLHAGKKEAAAQIVKRKAALIARQNEKGRNPKRK